MICLGVRKLLTMIFGCFSTTILGYGLGLRVGLGLELWVELVWC